MNDDDRTKVVRALAVARPSVLPSAETSATAPRVSAFHGSMPGPCAHLSTLRRYPREYLRMTRCHCGLLKTFSVADLDYLLLAGLPAHGFAALYPSTRAAPHNTMRHLHKCRRDFCKVAHCLRSFVTFIDRSRPDRMPSPAPAYRDGQA
jgi:hypothetical protein